MSRPHVLVEGLVTHVTQSDEREPIIGATR